jgi:hypothetical protein
MDGAFRDADLEIAMEALYVGMVLPVSVDIESPVATGSREDVGP